MVIEHNSRGDREYDIYSRLLNERIVFLGTPIDDQVANLSSPSCSTSSPTDPDKDISIYINSPGGDVYSGLAIYDTMQFIKPDVQTICFGIADLDGLAAADRRREGQAAGAPQQPDPDPPALGRLRGPGHRHRDPRPRDARHCASGSTRSTPHHTGQPLEQVHDDMERDRFFTADEAVEYGLIDRVIDEH